MAIEIDKTTGERRSVATNAADTQTALTPSDLSHLESMTQPELVALIRRVSGAMWGIGMMTPDDIASAMKLKLAHAGLTEKEMHKALPAMDRWFDREIGKPKQTISADVTQTFSLKADQDLLDRIKREMLMGGKVIDVSPLPQSDS